jgi:hypothetical protein
MSRVSIFLSFWLLTPIVLQGSDQIQPWETNPSYWQYKGVPLLLLGGSDDDNLFQWPEENLRQHLDLIASTGANYVRNTMSDRQDKGFELYPFLQLPSGKYDLDRWNPKYWERFEHFLDWTAERDIIVQIEIWDRFDYSRGNWPGHPYNPINNVNYTQEESGLAPEYPEHPGRNLQPFFFTTPSQQDNQVVLRFQQAFVDKLLSYSLKHGNVLYCVDNETSGEEEWGRYWANHIKARAGRSGVSVYVTEMWDAWDIKADEHRRTLDHPDLYDFVDVSQNNHNKGEEHWQNAIWVREYLSAAPRPINTVKTYGADDNKFGHSDRDGVERVLRHVFAGLASTRFHRPPSGLGLNKKAQAVIKAVRKLESLFPFWRVSPRMDLLGKRTENEAYLAAAPGEAYLLYFTDGGSVELEMKAGTYRMHWINGNSGEAGSVVDVEATSDLSITAPSGGTWLAAVLKR